MHDALEQQEEEENSEDSEENDEEDSDSCDPDQDESVVNVPEHEVKHAQEAMEDTAVPEYNNKIKDIHSSSLLESPMKLQQDQLPQDSPLAPTLPVATTAALSRPATSSGAAVVDSPPNLPQRDHSSVDAEPAPVYDPTDDSVLDLVPVPFSQRAVSPTTRPGSSHHAAVTTDLRPLTASMVNALPSSGAALENTAAIENYSAAAYQVNSVIFFQKSD